MSKMNQKTAVYNAITSVLKENGVDFEDGMDVGPLMTRELRAQVNQILFEGFKNEEIEIDGTRSDSELKSYVSGLQSNWIRKDKRLNGDTKYVAKNPGSRAGQGDPQLRAMRNLLKLATTDEDRAEIQEHIEQRMAAIAAEKAKSLEIDFTHIPAALREKYLNKQSS